MLFSPLRWLLAPFMLSLPHSPPPTFTFVRAFADVDRAGRTIHDMLLEHDVEVLSFPLLSLSSASCVSFFSLYSLLGMWFSITPKRSLRSITSVHSFFSLFRGISPTGRDVKRFVNKNDWCVYNNKYHLNSRGMVTLGFAKKLDKVRFFPSNLLMFTSCSRWCKLCGSSSIYLPQILILSLRRFLLLIPYDSVSFWFISDQFLERGGWRGGRGRRSVGGW